MAGTVKHARLESRTARRKLNHGRQPHWIAVVPQRVHLGWQRWEDDDAGRWMLRRYISGKYSSLTIGRADDTEDADGERVLSYEQAQAKVRALLNIGRANRLTVRWAMEEYVAYLDSKGQSTRTVLSHAEVHILPPLGDFMVSALTAQQLRSWLATLATSPGQTRPKDGKPQYLPAPSDEDAKRRRRVSANRILTTLKAALNHMYDEGHVSQRDAWGRKLKPFEGVELARASWLDTAAATRLINAADPEFRPLVRAALETGCRYGELTRMKVSDFNVDAGTVAIQRSKSGKSRHVVLTEKGTAFFVQQCAGRSGSELLLPRVSGKAWQRTEQARPMLAACARAGVKPGVSFHILRHTWASLAVMSGVPLLVVAKNLGHRDTRMVEKHYGHLAESYVTEAIRRGAPRYDVETAEP
jgi:integrase